MKKLNGWTSTFTLLTSYLFSWIYAPPSYAAPLDGNRSLLPGTGTDYPTIIAVGGGVCLVAVIILVVLSIAKKKKKAREDDDGPPMRR